MTTKVKDLDGGRTIEIERQEGTIFLETGLDCLVFDVALLLRAIERELGVLLVRTSTRISDCPGGEGHCKAA